MKKDPVAPLRRLPHPPEFALRQQGESIFIEGVVRPAHQNGEPLIEAEITIWRTEQPAEMMRFPPAEVFRQEAMLAATLIVRPAEGGGAFVFEDTYPAGKTDSAFFYGVEARNERGRRSEMKDIFRIASLRFAAPPEGLEVEATEKAILLRWSVVEPPPLAAPKEAPSAPKDGQVAAPAVEAAPPSTPKKKNSSKAAKEKAAEKTKEENAAEKQPEEEAGPAPWAGARYVVLRSENGGAWTRLTPEPIEETAYRDAAFAFGRVYAYRVRSVVEHGAESADSATVEARPVDVFPPATPEGFSASVEGVSIRLFWLPNQEADLAGYHVYRSEQGGEFARLTASSTDKIVFVDENIAVGGRYVYRLTATDRDGNESAPTAGVERLVRPETAAP